MIAGKGNREKWLQRDAGVQAVIIDTLWERGFRREVVGRADVRCKVQLAGAPNYMLDGKADASLPQADFAFIHKPAGSVKEEFIAPGTQERSIYFVFPVVNDTLAGYDSSDEAVERALSAVGKGIYSNHMRMPQHVRMLAHDIMRMDSSARSFKRLQEARIDELSLICLDAFLNSFLDQSGQALTAADRRRALEARDRLISDFSNPPNLSMLARLVGTNRTTLNRAFNQLFGVSPFQLLQRERMATARILLGDEGYSISEVAEMCGYEHVSNFSLAFKAFHGFTPAQVRSQTAQ